VGVVLRKSGEAQTHDVPLRVKVEDEQLKQLVALHTLQ
jgi:hypothetical protein